MGALLGMMATLFRWAGAFRGLWAFVVPFWGMVRGWMGRRSAAALS
ncbi:hypothetical protein [Effusibacillus consociatus]|uniref:Uncharacterized protein n=1 Tax=Effusibacillus consociatus TaxID=1117041 RepID=A0ABV9PYE1_9BACL